MLEEKKRFWQWIAVISYLAGVVIYLFIIYGIPWLKSKFLQRTIQQQIRQEENFIQEDLDLQTRELHASENINCKEALSKDRSKRKLIPPSSTSIISAGSLTVEEKKNALKSIMNMNRSDAEKSSSEIKPVKKSISSPYSGERGVQRFSKGLHTNSKPSEATSMSTNSLIRAEQDKEYERCLQEDQKKMKEKEEKATRIKKLREKFSKDIQSIPPLDSPIITILFRINTKKDPLTRLKNLSNSSKEQDKNGTITIKHPFRCDHSIVEIFEFLLTLSRSTNDNEDYDHMLAENEESLELSFGFPQVKFTWKDYQEKQHQMLSVDHEDDFIISLRSLQITQDCVIWVNILT